MSRLAGMSFGALLEAVAAKTPTPGGGAVACGTGALAASLAGMVVAYSEGKKSLAEHKPELERARGALENLRRLFLELAEEDAAAYGLVNELMKLPEGDARRGAELPGALEASIQVPMAAIAAAGDLLRLCERLAGITNPMLKSDLGIAVVLGEAAGRASLWNVRVNAGMLGEGARGRWMTEAERMLGEAAARAGALSERLA